MNGKDYIATETLWSKRDGRIVIAAKPGETCERVTPTSLPFLLKRGHIAAVTPKADAPASEPSTTDGEAVPTRRRAPRRSE
jgi:hypothetical protein